MNRLSSSHVYGDSAGHQSEQIVEGQTLTGRVRLDGVRFRNCAFLNATLQYCGMSGTEISGCTFTNTQIEFDGPAANALALLKAMSRPGSGMAAIVKASFPHVFGH